MSPDLLQLTFLFTDIEGSTRRWEADPDAMRGELSRHFRILQEVVASHGGVVESETGDGILATFPTATEAVGASVEGQRGLLAADWGSEPLRVRMGIHTGEAERKPTGLHGTEVHRAARLTSTAHGGQILVSEATHALVRDDPPPEIGFLDLGAHRLKDLARPEHLFQVTHPDLSARFPPLRSLEGFPNNLPAQLSSFVGREEELQAVGDTLGESRLVTLIGAGGSGKTRLGLQVAAERIERHPDGVWLVELGGLADPDLLDQTVVSTLGLPERADRPLLDTLTAYLRERALLLLPDNCEHLIEAAAVLTETLLQNCPDVRVLATSREPLGVPGEVTWRVPSLELPSGDTAHLVDDPPESLVLFVERARAAEPGFTLTADNAPVVATICRRLDGLPLAIELAASRVRALSVKDIAQRLEDRFALLQAGSRTALPRQRTLESAVAWSYDLLDPEEQELFAHLGVFRGSFDLEAAEAVAAVGDVEASRMLDLLTGLVDKSLLTVIREGERVRYRMLETIRHYARTRLAESPDAEAVREAHTQWALDFATRAGQQMIGPEQREWFRRIQSTLDDLRAALERALDQGEVATGLRLMVALDNWWVLTSVPEASYWLERLLAADEETGSEVVAEALAPAFGFYGQLQAFGSHPEAAVSTLERSLELFEEVDDPRGQAYAQHMLGIAMWDLQEAEKAREMNRRALEAFQEMGDPAGITRTLFLLGLWELHFGEPGAASELADRLTAVGERTGVPLIRAHAAELQGLAAHFGDDHEDARTYFREAVSQFRQVGRVQCLVHYLTHVSLWTLAEGRPDAAASLLGAVHTLREEHLAGTGPAFELAWNETASEGARKALEPDDFERSFGDGSAKDPDQAVDLAEAVLR
jgi:predicted ATPase/class 3 adenylate cyclase